MKKGTTLFIAIICILAITTIGLYTGYEEKKEQIDALKQDMLIRDDMDGAYNEEIAEKDKQIGELADTIEEKDRKIQDLKDDLEEMKQQVATLTDDAEQYVEQINALNADVSSRDSRIGELEAAIAEKDSKIGELEGGISAAQEQIDSLNTDLTDKSKSIDALNADIVDKNSQIESLTAESDNAKATTQTIQNLETELAGKEEKIKELNDSIAEKDETIEDLKVKNQNLQNLLNTFAQDQDKQTAGTNGLASERPTVTMEFDKYTLSEPGKIHVVITVTNAGEEDLKEPVTLYYPNDKKVEEFGEDGLPAGKARSWTGEWDVTQEQLDEGKVVFFIRYAIYDGDAGEDGLPTLRQHKMFFSKKIIKGK